MILKALVLKQFEFDKGSSLFQPISRMNYKNERAVKICCCSSVRVKGGMNLRNGMLHGLRNDIIIRNVMYAE